MAFATSPASALNPWLQILAALEKKVIRQSYETWLKPTRYSHAAGRTLYVRVPSPEFQHIGDKYGDLIQEAIDLQSLEFDDVSFVTAERRSLDSAAAQGWRLWPVPAHAPTAPPPAQSHRAPEQGRFDWSTAAQLNSRYTFDNFVIGNGNQFARAAVAGRRRAALARLQSALPLWRRRHGQDPPDARHRPRGEAPPAHRRASATSPRKSSPTR